MRIFRRFNEVGVTVLIASHDIALIDRLGCRRIELDGGRTRMQTISHFPSLEAMEQMIEMGMVEGIEAAAGQIDASLAEG